jgi:A/G-specific adenine glycosylase
MPRSPDTATDPGDTARGELQDAVRSWYDTVRRDLPWRRTTDPYAILVSEVMSQQTQVARIVPRYEAWLERWPHETALADAATADVLGAWVGLGYNSRALRLQQACVVVARDGWPRTAAGLRDLPGVGPYTAAAVASFAFGEQIACVDTNVRRVAERIGRGSPEELLPHGDAATWNQAVMELGALVCGARSARCGACPAAPWCASKDTVVPAQRRPAGSAVRFEDTNRWVRGRIVAALSAGEALPGDIDAARVRVALDGLVRDGLVEERGGGVTIAGGPPADVVGRP